MLITLVQAHSWCVQHGHLKIISMFVFMIIIMIIILTMINDDDDLNTLVDFAVSGRAGVGARVLRCHSSVDDLIIVMMMIMIMTMMMIIIIMIKT